MSELRYRNLDRCESFQRLADEEPHHPTKLTVDRIREYDLPVIEGLRYNFSAKAVSGWTIDQLVVLAEEQQILEKFRALAKGAVMNTGEGRKVLHHLLRGELDKPVVDNGRDLGAFYREQQERVYAFAKGVETGEITGSTGKQFNRVIQIGIGGSDLGPRALYIALVNYLYGEGRRPKMVADFISNVDPDDAAAVVREIDAERTLFILVSKSGTTQETLTNERFVIESLERAGVPGLKPRKHIVAVTSQTSPLAKSSDYLDAFYIDDYIGGRYSGTSAVGTTVLSLALGSDIVAQFLAGAHEADLAALNNPLHENATALDALIGVYERNILNLPATAVLPYSQALTRFPAHLQQLDMESNGKRVNREGEPVSYPTGPIIFGEPGTNGQHSFYQLLHQGTDIVPLQFIGFRESQSRRDVSYEESDSQTKLKANLAAQIVAFAMGKSDTNPNKQFPGGRPSSLLYADRLTPRILGALLAHFENKVMFQGFLWNLNSFDQEGVQLGKVLTKELLAGGASPQLQAVAQLLGV
ncbi:MAG: glucose-6-phosphate isomerase [Alkalispirochaetaceae bacterium]